MSFDTIDLLTGNNFQVTWDLGRRCNYDCSYCQLHAYNPVGKQSDELKSTWTFYLNTSIHISNIEHPKEVSISLTEANPTKSIL